MDLEFRLIDNLWGETLDKAVQADHSSIRIICPFIKLSVIKSLLKHGKPETLKVITRFNLDEFYLGVNDVSAMRLLVDSGAQIKGLRNLHSKVYLFGDACAIATSANLTQQALSRNHEFGFRSTQTAVVKACQDYFDRLWAIGEAVLTPEQLLRWETKLAIHRRAAGPVLSGTRLGDEGAEAGFEPAPLGNSAGENGSSQAFVKFFGEGTNRANSDMSVLEELGRSGSHWACTYPRGKRPRRVEDGDMIFVARMVKPTDYLIYGRAIATKHVEGVDDATPEDVRLRSWKEKWPHYVRVYNGVYVKGTLANGVSLKRLIAELGADAFASTQRNLLAGKGNTNPMRSLKQQPDVRLSEKAFAWMNAEFDRAIATHGRLGEVDMKVLDWPLSQRLSADGKALLKIIVDRLNKGTISVDDTGTFLGYRDAATAIGIKGGSGREFTRELRDRGMDELNEWAKTHRFPAVTGFIVRKRRTVAPRPGPGYFTENGRKDGDLAWWKEEMRAASHFDWKPFIEA